MYIAQKILKSMSSMTNEINEENEDLNELIFTPKSGLVSPILNRSMSARQPSLSPPTDESFTIDPLSEISQEPELNTTIDSRLKKVSIQIF